MELIAIGLATAFNLIILRVKWSHERYADALLDLSILVLLGLMFKGTISGMTIAMVTSLVISIYLLIFPPKFMES